jgi:CIC family chloride channel protein
MTGGVVGTVAHHFFPFHTATAGAYALVGMGAVFAGVVRAPMTSVLMIFEMTQDYAVIVPLMIANLVSLFVASRLQHEPIYEALAVQDGIHLPSSKSRQASARLRAGGIMKPAGQMLPATMTMQEALVQVQTGAARSWLVKDERGVIGVLDRAQLERELADAANKELGSLVDALVFPHVHADQGLDVALERMGTNHLDLLPVVNRADIHKLEGVVTLHDVLSAYGVAGA